MGKIKRTNQKQKSCNTHQEHSKLNLFKQPKTSAPLVKVFSLLMNPLELSVRDLITLRLKTTSITELHTELFCSMPQVLRNTSVESSCTTRLLEVRLLMEELSARSSRQEEFIAVLRSTLD